MSSQWVPRVNHGPTGESHQVPRGRSTRASDTD
ncbi:hypothetical protein BVI2075_280060 [Burkholderia vietnamiensis]|nr:hypothetical protein BVI2075_280060 [Burkholderia vietnamiensis]